MHEISFVWMLLTALVSTKLVCPNVKPNITHESNRTCLPFAANPLQKFNENIWNIVFWDKYSTYISSKGNISLLMVLQQQ